MRAFIENAPDEYKVLIFVYRDAFTGIIMPLIELDGWKLVKLSTPEFNAE